MFTGIARSPVRLIVSARLAGLVRPAECPFYQD